LTEPGGVPTPEVVGAPVEGAAVVGGTIVGGAVVVDGVVVDGVGVNPVGGMLVEGVTTDGDGGVAAPDGRLEVGTPPIVGLLVDTPPMLLVVPGRGVVDELVPPGSDGLVMLLVPNVPVPVVEGTLPVVEGTLPVVEGTLPVVEGTLPVVEGTLPVVEGTLSVVEGTLPVVEGAGVGDSCASGALLAEICARADGRTRSLMGMPWR
jgi:hypothetical protein